MGAVIQGDRLNHAGTLRFWVMRDGDDNDPSVRPCLPVGPNASGADFSFSRVFWQVSGLSPEETISPTYDVFKVYLRSAERSTGTAADCHIPLSLTTERSIFSGTWQIAAELGGWIYHACGARGLVLVSDNFRDANSGGAPLAYFSASCRMEEENHDGIHLSTKPLCRDHIGHPVPRNPDSLGVIHLDVRDADSSPLAGAALSDWAVRLYFYRVK